MYRVNGRRGNHTFKIMVDTLRRAISIADTKIEEGYEGVKIETYNGQLPLFDGE